MEPVSQRTYDRIAALTREDRVADETIAYCPCRLLPETVLNLRTVMREIERLWQETLGAERWSRLRRSSEAGRFFAGEVRIVEVQAGRPEMVAVWLPVPSDYPRRINVRLIDMVEPFEPPSKTVF